MKKYLVCLLAIVSITFASPSAKAQAGKDEALEALGGVSALMIYNTYGLIGALGDGFEDGVYDAEFLATNMDEQISGITSVIDQFKKLQSSGFLTNPSDKQYVGEMLKTFGDLKNMATYLKEYGNTKSQESADAFQDARDKAWEGISSILGLE